MNVAAWCNLVFRLSGAFILTVASISVTLAQSSKEQAAPAQSSPGQAALGCEIPAPFEAITEPDTYARYQLTNVATVADVPQLTAMIAPETQSATASATQSTTASKNPAVILLNMWASWCPSCREELPELAAIASAFSAGMSAGMSAEVSADMSGYIIAANVGDTPAVVAEISAPLHASLAVPIVDNPSVLADLDLAGLPATLVWQTRQGKIYLGMGRLPEPALLKAWLVCLASQE
ncbi:TlpA family protein disulfide reductase [Ostreibacterium oceani]|uniref:Thioredoxin domain-containing protein n=1 Tax=Ostreibacterium oceani TaxID=2654998 RepID=A0A6N7EWL3_9GAMM|nr:TlpA family protein disulfide reductase [Ostreibacterium oceani]MPV85809.1 hypothetical protein [Ostreibacterium oceani]